MQHYLFQNITWCIYQSFLFFAVAYIAWSLIKKVQLIKTTAAQNFNILLSTLTIGIVHFLYLLVASRNAESSNSQFYLLPNAFNNLVQKIIVVIYALGILFKFSVFLYKKITAKSVFQKMEMSEDFQSYFSTLCQHINVKIPALYWCSKAAVPYTKGFAKKIIVLPIAMANHFSIAETEAILYMN